MSSPTKDTTDVSTSEVSNRAFSGLDLDTPEKPYLDSNELILNMGPQHPATHGVLRVILKLDGEKVLGTECVIGYLHRGVEKIAENRTYAMFNPYVDRMDYVAAVSNGLGYCEAVEKLMNVEAPPRAKYMRVILTELNRIASHQLWLGTHALDIGAMTPLFYTFRDREEILKIFERYCGARLTTHAFRIGGCQYETYAGFEKDVKNFLTHVAPKIDEYEALLTAPLTSCSARSTADADAVHVVPRQRRHPRFCQQSTLGADIRVHHFHGSIGGCDGHELARAQGIGPLPDSPGTHARGPARIAAADR
jgi:hypothetical protein